MQDPIFQHHATGIVGDSSDIILRLSGVIDLKNNPDFFNEKFETLTIEDSRRIREIHESRPFSSEVPRVFVIEIHGATREAQNALLKTLEEPRPNNYFFIIMPSLDMLLPTVRSRLHIAKGITGDVVNASGVVPTTTEAVAFLRMQLSEKIAFADDLAAQVSDEKMTKHDAVAFLNSLERTIYSLHPKKDFSAKQRTAFVVIARARDYMNDRAPSVKMLLEYVALSV